MKPGVKLETFSWIEAEQWFADDPVVVIPLGAAAKEHGPHLPLNNNAIIAAWLGEQISARLPVVITQVLLQHVLAQIESLEI
jgi:creatinine amidohydrolase